MPNRSSLKKNRWLLLRRVVPGFLAIMLVMGHAGSVHADNATITQAGNFLQYILPGIAVGSTFVAGNPDGGWWDREGTKEAVLSFATTEGLVVLGKGTARKLRPDGSDRNSFPSGHTAAAFSGASFIGTRYGWYWGVPAYAAAAFVGYSRFQADQHYADDVLAGASIALLSHWAWVKPANERVALLPMVMERGVGIQLALLEGDPAEKGMVGTPYLDRGYPKYRFNFNFGPAFVLENKVTTKGGTTLDLKDLQDNENPLTTAFVQFDVALNNRHEIGFSVWPMEAKGGGSFKTPMVFGDAFAANAPVQSDWRLFDLRARYRYEFFPTSPFIFAAGGGVMLQYHIVKLETADHSLKVEESDTSLVPFLHLKLGWRITEKISLYINGDAGWVPDSRFFDGGAYVSYRFRNHWDFTAGYQYFTRDIDGDVRNKLVQQLPYLAVAYNW